MSLLSSLYPLRTPLVRSTLTSSTSSGRRFTHTDTTQNLPSQNLILQNPAKNSTKRIVLYPPTRRIRKMGLKERAPRPGEKYPMQQTHGYVAPFEPPKPTKSNRDVTRKKEESTDFKPADFKLSSVLTSARAEMRKQMELLQRTIRPDPYKTYKEQVTEERKKLQASIDILPRDANVRNFGRKKGGYDAEKVAQFVQARENVRREDPWESKTMHRIVPGENEILRVDGKTLGIEPTPKRKFAAVPRTHSAIVRRVSSVHTEATEAGLIPDGGDFVYTKDRAQRIEHRLQHERKLSDQRLERLMHLYHRAEDFVTEENLDQKISDFLIEENLNMGATLGELLLAHQGSDEYYSIPYHVKGRPTQLKDALEGTILGGKISVQAVKEFQRTEAFA